MSGSLWIGTYPDAGVAGSGEGIWRVGVDAATGELSDPRLVVETPAPSFLALHPSGRTLYAVAELDEGAVTAFAVSADGLVPLDTRPTGGALPCHALATSGTLHVANYGSGHLTTFGLAADGGFAGGPETYGNTGRGPDSDRQEGPHAHYVGIVGDEVWVSDLGTDELRRYRPRSGDVSPAGTAARLPLGAGPRHFVTVGDAVVVVTELDAGLYVLSPESGAVRARYDATATPGHHQPSHLALSPDGTRLFVAVRGVDVLSTFAVAEGDAGLEHLADTPLARWPRHFAVLPPVTETDAALVVVADQQASTLTALRVDRETGRGTTVGSVPLPAPACVLPTGTA
ncbi:lactonase family protein [Pseudonocardia aurantiaca]|uniref:Lactonase family protein n=1 Tax=Pseudonocardia aurantiaca TaxID=75290 RepID=A0ABW4FPG5_9PSEU